jgi:hypothetical protein
LIILIHHHFLGVNLRRDIHVDATVSYARFRWLWLVVVLVIAFVGFLGREVVVVINACAISGASLGAAYNMSACHCPLSAYTLVDHLSTSSSQGWNLGPSLLSGELVVSEVWQASSSGVWDVLLAISKASVTEILLVDFLEVAETTSGIEPLNNEC